MVATKALHSFNGEAIVYIRLRVAIWATVPSVPEKSVGES